MPYYAGNKVCKTNSGTLKQQFTAYFSRAYTQAIDHIYVSPATACHFMGAAITGAKAFAAPCFEQLP